MLFPQLAVRNVGHTKFGPKNNFKTRFWIKVFNALSGFCHKHVSITWVDLKEALHSAFLNALLLVNNKLAMFFKYQPDKEITLYVVLLQLEN